MKKFEEPTLIEILFDSEDIIVASYEDETMSPDGGDGDNEDEFGS